ncbi:MAG: AbrB/MazE/SpoVT family DNA-binding domain-containing protein [Verrucomicrobiales bacterium]
MTPILTEKYQVNIPPEIATELRIAPGTKWEWTLTQEGSVF